ncbi:MAG: hypothetical protein QOG59_1309, partial [Solirubrobacteraceae bacterium]|nr:hypothetical protein [Solirubrobacteraceae bacterium]
VDHEHPPEGLSGEPANLMWRTSIHQQDAHVSAFQQLQRGDQTGQAGSDHHHLNPRPVKHEGTVAPTGTPRLHAQRYARDIRGPPSSMCVGRDGDGATRDAADFCRPRDRQSHRLDHFTVEHARDDVLGVSLVV